MSQQAGEPVSWPQIVAQWALLEFSFHSALGVDLEDVWRVKSWRWFAARVRGLLSTDTPLARFFAPDEAAPEQPEVSDV